MAQNPFPESYEEWRHCITVDCGIPLSAEFIAQRLAIWRDEGCEETLRFRRLYGDQYWKMMTAWFEQAERELAR